MIKCENCEEQEAKNFCPVCSQNQCESCTGIMHQFNNKKFHLEMLQKVKRTEFYKCSEHNHQLLSFCTNCREFVCFACCLKGGNHENHKVFLIKDNHELLQSYSLHTIQDLLSLNEKLTIKVDELKKRIDFYQKINILIEKFMEERKDTKVVEIEFMVELFQFSKLIKDLKI